MKQRREIWITSTMSSDETSSPDSVPSSRIGYEELGAVSPPDLIVPLPIEHQYQHDTEFSTDLYEVEVAIDSGIYPELIHQGSSGSYFARDRNLVSICCHTVQYFRQCEF